jgi:hypothetical protein
MDNEARTRAYGAQLEHCGPIRKRSSFLTPFCHTRTFSHFQMQELAPPVLMLEAPFAIVRPQEIRHFSHVNPRDWITMPQNVWRYRNGGVGPKIDENG